MTHARNGTQLPHGRLGIEYEGCTVYGDWTCAFGIR